ncbi:MAG: M14 family metallopeptidase [Anaerolineales bacterium]
MKRTEIEPLPSHQRISKWITGLWILALGFLIAFSAYYFTNDARNSPSLIPSSAPTGTAAQRQVVAAKNFSAAQPTKTPPPPTPTQNAPTPTSTSPPPTAVIAKRLLIGKSVAGRHLEVFQFGTGDRERLIIAGIHGGYEWNTIALADEIIQYLKNHPDLIPKDTTLYILRSLNPDGEARAKGIKGRANDHGVDLNRNFPNRWQSDWPRDGCWNFLPITAGTAPASEPETKALIGFINAHEIDALISYHSAALGIFAGGQPPTSESISLAEEIASVSDYPYPPIDTGCIYTGQLIDWAAARGIAALDIELANHYDTDFKQNLVILSRFLSWKPNP